MASKAIKGLTIEISGDTTKLGQALKGVEKNSKDIQTELKSVERLLKLNPKNTELVRQQQELLAKAVTNSREKLDTLKKAQEQANKSFAEGKIGEEQYRAIQREVMWAERELKGLEKRLSDVNSKWKAAADGLDNFGKKSEAAGKKMLPVTAGILAAGGAALVMATQFDDAMAKVATIADTSQVPLDELKKSIVDMSNETGIAAGEMAEAVYNAISAGQDTADAVAFVGQSAALAKAGFADSASALDLLTTTLNAYELESSEAAKVSDILIQTQNKGKVTVAELATSMGKIIPTAKAANVNLEQLGAGYALMTSKGIAAAETTTYMNSMLNELTKSGSKSSAALKKSTGKTFEQLSAEGMSLSDVLLLLDEDAKKSGIGLKDMFGSAEAGKAALTLVTNEGKAFNELVKDMQASTGATAGALEKLQTPGEKSRKAINELKNEFMEFGDILTPILEMATGLLKRVSGFFGGLTDAQKKTIVVVLGLVAAIGPLLIFIGKMAQGVSSIMTLMTKLGPTITVVKGAFAALMGPIGLVILGIAAAIAIGVLLYKNWDKIKEFAGNLRDTISGAFAKLKESVSNAFKALLDIDVVQLGKDMINGLIKGITGMGGAVLDATKNIGANALKGIKGFLGIKSPSKVFEQMGNFTAEGFAKGLQGTRKSLADAAKGMSQQVTSSVSEVMHKGTITVQGVNNQGELVASQNIIMDELRRGSRR